jgi:glutamate 5-kinase
MKKIIIKVGTSTLTQGTKKLSRQCMLSLVQQIAALHNKGIELILVSSGAVAAGKDLFADKNVSKKLLASIGQVKLMQVWSELFSLFELQIGQILLTKEDFSDRKLELTRETLNMMLEHRVIPIINENDPLFTKEWGVGDNDNLAALVAHAVDADTMILLTDQEGFYTANPCQDDQAKLISVVECIDDAITACAAESGTTLGTGGMMTKIEAARKATQSGIRTIIASSERPNVLIDLAEGKQIGTLFLEEEKV